MGAADDRHQDWFDAGLETLKRRMLDIRADVARFANRSFDDYPNVAQIFVTVPGIDLPDCVLRSTEAEQLVLNAIRQDLPTACSVSLSDDFDPHLDTSALEVSVSFTT